MIIVTLLPGYLVYDNVETLPVTELRLGESDCSSGT
jgi:hypothetical protein